MLWKDSHYLSDKEMTPGILPGAFLTAALRLAVEGRKPIFLSKHTQPQA